MAKTLITPSYVFTPGASGVGTLSFASYPDFNINKLYGVINTTANTAIYLPTATSLGYSSYSAGVLTLQANTSSMNSTDNLLISYDTNTILVTGASSQSAAVNNILTPTAGTGATDVREYTHFSVQINQSAGITAGAFIFEGSHDNTNFSSIPVFLESNYAGGIVTGTITATASTISTYIGVINHPYIRLRISTAITGGTIQSYTLLFQSAGDLPPVLPTGASTSALQTTGNTSLSTIATNTTGIATAANQTTGNTSLSTIATNTGSGGAMNTNLNTIVTNTGSGGSMNTNLSTIATNTTGIATSALQTTGNTSLSTIATNTGSGGAMNTNLDTIVTNTGSGGSMNTNLSTIATNTTGVATAANQTTGNTSLSTIATNTTGIATAANQTTMITDLSSIITNTTSYSNIIGAASQATLNNNVLLATAGTGSITTNGFNSFSVVIQGSAGITAGAYIFEGSHDNTNFVVIPVYLENTINTSPIVIAQTATSNSTITYVGAIKHQFIRCRISTAITGGTIQAFATLYLAPSVYEGSDFISSLNAITKQNSLTTDYSGTITTTTTTASIAISQYTGFNVAVNVSAVSGTTPTLDVVVQESSDNGTSWYTVYSFPRITATTANSIVSPNINYSGTLLRYVLTVGGTTPSFTYSINRTSLTSSNGNIRQMFDRTIAPNTLNSSTATLNLSLTSNVLVVGLFSAVGTSPTFQTQMSSDGTNWYSIGGTINAFTANTAKSLTITNVSDAFVRVICSTAGTGTNTLSYVMVRAF